MTPSRGSRSGDFARWQQQQLREVQRAQKAAEAAARAAQRDERARAIADGKRDAEERTAALQRRTEELERLLIAGLNRSARIDLSRLLRRPRDFTFDAVQLGEPVPRPTWRHFEPGPPSFVVRLVGRARRETKVAAARQQYEKAEAAWSAGEQSRLASLAVARVDHEERLVTEREACEAHNLSVRTEINDLAARAPEPVERYLQQVLKGLPLPEQFPRRAEVAFNPGPEQIVVQLQLPSTDIVPTVRAVRFVQSRGMSDDVPRPQQDLGEIYRNVIAQVALLAVRDLFDADAQLQQVAFNGHVDAVNRATGKREYPCIVSLSVERAKFEELVLDRVAPADCLRHLNAVVSPHPYELKPIQPILDFDLSKYSFVQGLDAVATLDHRPDLIQMSYGDFEHLVRQVFEAMGMQGWTTTASNDDGVDAVVMNPTPFVGGLTIVQAKHYKNVVGVNHIRELAGAMEEKKAGRGILVTTSWFTSGGWQKAREHGRMELIDGARLIYLIKQHLGKDVLIGIARPRNVATGA
jgi:restriction system protein